MSVFVMVNQVSQWMKLSLDANGISTGARAVVELRDPRRALCIKCHYGRTQAMQIRTERIFVV